MNHKELVKLIKILRKFGVNEYDSGNIRLILGPEPEPKARKTKKESEEKEQLPLYSEEDVLFWSSTGVN